MYVVRRWVPRLIKGSYKDNQVISGLYEPFEWYPCDIYPPIWDVTTLQKQSFNVSKHAVYGLTLSGILLREHGTAVDQIT